MFWFKKREDRYVTKREFEELTDDVRSLQVRLRKLRARHLAEDNADAHSETVDLRQQAAAVLQESRDTTVSIGTDRASLNRLMLQRKR